MKIICPQCRFERDVPEDRLPANSVIATCPRCRHRFRISRDDVEELAESAATPTPDGDDPLPPGAIIPGAPSDDGPAAAPSEPSAPQKVSPSPRNAPRPEKAAESEPDTPHDDDKEYRKNAAEAYERQAAEGGDPAFALDNPWDHPERDGYLPAFYQTAMRVMFAASRFFAGLRSDVPQSRALIFFLAICIFQVLVERLWVSALSMALAPSATTDPQLQQLLQLLSPQISLPLTVLVRTAINAIELFLAAGLCHIAFKIIAPANADYQRIFQVLAYSSAPNLLCLVPVVGSVAGLIWSIACSFIGCRYALRLSWGQTLATLLPIYLLIGAFLIMVAQVTMRA